MSEAYEKSKEAVEAGLVAIIEDSDGDKYFYVQNEYGCLCVKDRYIYDDLKHYLKSEHHCAKIDGLKEDFLISDKFIGTTTVTELMVETMEQL